LKPSGASIEGGCARLSVNVLPGPVAVRFKLDLNRPLKVPERYQKSLRSPFPRTVATMDLPFFF